MTMRHIYQLAIEILTGFNYLSHFVIEQYKVHISKFWELADSMQTEIWDITVPVTIQLHLNSVELLKWKHDSPNSSLASTTICSQRKVYNKKFANDNQNQT